MPKPTLSVLIPNYNHGRHITHCLDHIFSQEFLPTEVIVIDDCSTDDSASIIERYASRNSRLRFYRNPTNRGVMRTMNRALGLARGDYVYGGAADDWVAPGTFQKTMELLENYPEAGLCFGHISHFYQDSAKAEPQVNPICGHQRYFSPDDLAEAFSRVRRSGDSIVVPGNGAVWKRVDFIRAGGYREELRWYGDWFTLQVVALRHGACFIPESLAFTRMDDRSFSHAGQRRWQEQRIVLDRMLSRIKARRFRDVLPHFQQGHVFSQMVPGIVRVIVSQPEHWDRDSALLIQKAIPRCWRTFLLSEDPLVRRGMATCLAHLGPDAQAILPELCWFLKTKPKTCERVRLGLRSIGGTAPSPWPMYWRRCTKSALSVVKRPYQTAVDVAAGSRVWRMLLPSLTRGEGESPRSGECGYQRAPAPEAGQKMPARFHLITPVWSAKYVDLFVNLTLPTLLSPGNLPSLPREKCFYQIFTRLEDLERLVQAPAFKKLEKLMQVSIRQIDSMAQAHPYSVMSACHERAMRYSQEVDAVFIFSPPDHVWADGAFRRMLRLLAAGKRAILVAALRMRATEGAFEELKRHAVGWQKSVIQVPPRALVRTFLRFLHPLAIAHLCPMEDSPYNGNRSPGSYYWDVNGQGLLARCCHPHVMAVWPMVRAASIATTFDHELVRQCCPDYERVHVVTDSDEICAFEISDSLHHSLDWISWDVLDNARVVEWMNQWTNSYHRACLKKRIYLHASDVDEEWRPAIKKSDALVESYLAAYRKHHVRRSDKGEFLVGQSLRGNPHRARRRRHTARASLLSRLAWIAGLGWKAPRALVACTYRAINSKLYTRIARITGQLEGRIAHLERELAYQIAENKARAMHFRREIQMSHYASSNRADAAFSQTGGECEQMKPRGYPAAGDRIEAVA
jgi:glycosyltransferase involved in cell wall biosynthesis